MQSFNNQFFSVDYTIFIYKIIYHHFTYRNFEFKAKDLPIFYSIVDFIPHDYLITSQISTKDKDKVKTQCSRRWKIILL